MKKIIKIGLIISFIFYIPALAFLLFFGTRGFIWTDLTLLEYMKIYSNFVPFKTISVYINAIFNGSMNMYIPLKNLVGNIIMFMPMGVYLPYFLKRINKVRTFLISIIILLFAIETTQIVTRRGSFDIDDFILNMLGALIGYGIWKMKFVLQLKPSIAGKRLS